MEIGSRVGLKVEFVALMGCVKKSEWASVAIYHSRKERPSRFYCHLILGRKSCDSRLPREAGAN